MTVARLRLLVDVTRRRLRDRWRERRTGRRRRWDRVSSPAGAPQDVDFVLVRGATEPIQRMVAGDEYAREPDRASSPLLVGWEHSRCWTPRRLR